MKFHRRLASGKLDHMVGRRETDIAVHSNSSVLIYLIHGVTGTPAEMRYMAHALARLGCDAYATTLPGHCLRLRDLAHASEEEWRAHILTQLQYARRVYATIIVAGLSAGGHLAVDAAAHLTVEGLIIFSPTFFYDGWNTPWTNYILPYAIKWVPLPLQRFLFHVDGPPYGIKDPQLQEQIRQAYRPQSILHDWWESWWPWSTSFSRPAMTTHSAANSGNPIFPLISLTQIDRLIRRAKDQLKNVRVPTLIVQAVEDDMTSPKNARWAFEQIASNEKEILFLDDSYHVVTVDKQRKLVADTISRFFHLREAHV